MRRHVHPDAGRGLRPRRRAAAAAALGGRHGHRPAHQDQTQKAPLRRLGRPAIRLPLQGTDQISV